MNEERARFRRAMEHAAASEPDSEIARQHKLGLLGERVLEILREHPDAEAEAHRSVCKGWGSESDEVVFATVAHARSLGLLDGGEKPRK